MRYVLAGMISVLAGAVALPALAQNATETPALVLQGSGTTRSVLCTDTALTVEGARNVITASGHCSALTVRGDSNMVSAPLTGAAQIDIQGNHNRVRISSTPDSKPQLRMQGDANELIPSPYAVAPDASHAAITGTGLNLELDCNGQPYTFEAINSHLKLRGACTALTLRGEANLVEAELASGADVTVAGNAITLLYRVAGDGGAPNVTVAGMNSIALPAASLGSALAQQVPPAKLPLPLLLQLVSAQVQNNGTLVHLPAAAFNSAGLSPAGQITLQRLAGLMLQAWPRAVTITGHDADPGAGKQRATAVSDFLVGHGVPGLSADLVGERGEMAVDVLLMN